MIFTSCSFARGRGSTFTLIEMIVVLVIMSVMAAVVAPRLGDFYQDIKLSSTASRFKLLVQAAREEAALNNGLCRVVIRPGWREVRVETQKWEMVNSPREAVERINKSGRLGADSKDGRRLEFVPIGGDFSKMILPDGVSFNYISISGMRHAWVEEIVITFNSFHQPDEVDFVFENSLRQYCGLRLEAGGGIIHDIQVVKR